jgi:glycosyltransferase involved in cell wall biosynthesis
MNIVIVNFMHPETAHVSSMRPKLFAQALTRLGHRVVLLTHPHPGEDARLTPQELHGALADHNWSEFFHLTCPSLHDWRTTAARSTELPRPIRQAMIITEFLMNGNLWQDWVRGSRPYWGPLAASFQPDLIYAVCGDTGSLALAQGLARNSAVPWVMDHKDNWQRCIPKPLRSVLARRFSDAEGFTSNAQLHAAIAARYHHQRHAVVYSGVVPEMIARDGVVPDRKTFRLTLVGSVRDPELLQRFLQGLSNWLDSLQSGDRQLVELLYAGPSHERVRNASGVSSLSCRVRIERYLPLAELGRICQTAAVNTYQWSPLTFHHKLLELLACRRPVISFPGEHEESIRLAREIGGDLRPCSSDRALEAALSEIWHNWRNGSVDNLPSVDVTALTWDVMVRKLEAFLMEIHQAAIQRANGMRSGAT